MNITSKHYCLRRNKESYKSKLRDFDLININTLKRGLNTLSVSDANSDAQTTVSLSSNRSVISSNGSRRGNKFSIRRFRLAKLKNGLSLKSTLLLFPRRSRRISDKIIFSNAMRSFNDFENNFLKKIAKSKLKSQNETNRRSQRLKKLKAQKKLKTTVFRLK
jgi:hypothetical protein